MKKLLGCTVAAFVCAVLMVVVAAQTIPAEAQKHIDAAKAAAGTDHVGLFTPLCNGATALVNPPAPRGGGAGRGQGQQGGPPPPPARETWYAEPVKVFDNMYFVGQTEYSAWAITTSQGTKLPAVRARKPGEKHPYVVGNDVVRRYLTVANECGEAALAIVPAA